MCAACRDALDRLVGDDRCAGRGPPLSRGRADRSRAGPGPAADESLDFLAPSDWPDSLGRLGTYEVKGVLGRGGMGVVLKAFDPALSRNVAIKVMAAPLAACGAARRRFLREARAAAAVVHEHVVAVYAVDEAAGLPYLVMEYVPGRSLQDRLDRHGPLALQEVLRIGMQTAAGLAAAHAQGLVHRDVKPANILLENGVERVQAHRLRPGPRGGRRRRDPAAASSPARRTTWPRSRPAASRPTTAPTCSAWAARSTRCAPAIRRSGPSRRWPCSAASATTSRGRSARSTRTSPTGSRRSSPGCMAKDPAGRFQTAAEVADLLGRCLAHVQQPLTVPLPDEAIGAAIRPDSGRTRRRRWAAAARPPRHRRRDHGHLATMECPTPGRRPAATDRVGRSGARPRGPDRPGDPAGVGAPEAIRAHLHGRGDRPEHDRLSELGRPPGGGGPVAGAGADHRRREAKPFRKSTHPQTR